MARSKKSLIEDKELDELEKGIIQKIESYINEKLKLFLEKVKVKKDYYEMSFL